MANALTLIKGARLYGKQSCDLLTAGGTIVGINSDISLSGVEVQVVDASDCDLMPGIVDGHVHISGAGGEGGPETRTPEVPQVAMVEAGVTTVVGCQGMDGITRSLISLLMKAKGLRNQGISSWIYTGAYQVPTPTLSGDVARDLALFEEVIGVGEIAIADHRSSSPTVLELIKLAKQVRNGGMLGKKAGLVHLHMGDSPDPFGLIERAVDESELGFKSFYPTHCNRNSDIHEASKAYGKQGWVDLTTSSYAHYSDIEVKPSEAVMELLDAGVPLDHITMSSDGGGSLPHFDEQGNCCRMEIGSLKATWKEVWDLVDAGLQPEQAWQIVSENPARILKLRGKGRIDIGYDADLLLVKERELVAVMAGGKWLKRPHFSD